MRNLIQFRLCRIFRNLSKLTQRAFTNWTNKGGAIWFYIRDRLHILILLLSWFPTRLCIEEIFLFHWWACYRFFETRNCLSQCHDWFGVISIFIEFLITVIIQLKTLLLKLTFLSVLIPALDIIELRLQLIIFDSFLVFYLQTTFICNTINTANLTLRWHCVTSSKYV